jgi:hypothetical protein
MRTRSKDTASFPKAPTTSVLNQFQQGDLLFGLRQHIQPIANKLRSHYFMDVVANDRIQPGIPDLVNKRFNRHNPPVWGITKQSHYLYWLRHRHYLLKSGGKPLPDDNGSPAFRRACKLLLIDRHLSRKWRCHFITRGFNFKRACLKSDKGVTSSEMRAAFRDDKRHGKNPNILFYNRHNCLASPPWQTRDNKAYFEQYAENSGLNSTGPRLNK